MSLNKKSLLFLSLFLFTTIITSCAPTEMPTPEEVAVEEPVEEPVEEVEEYEAFQFEGEVPTDKEFVYDVVGEPSIFLPPGAVTQESNLQFESLSSWEAPPDSDSEILSAYEISLDESELNQPAEIGLPVRLSEEELANGEVYIAYYDAEQGWISLPSWYSEEDQKVYAITDHFSTFASIFSIFPKRPVITSKRVTPNPLQDVGFPTCFEDDLLVQIGAHDPDGEITSVQVGIGFYDAMSGALADMVRFTDAVYGAGLTMVSGGIAGTLTFASTATELAKVKDTGRVLSEFSPIYVDEQTGLYTASISLKELSTCKKSSDSQAVGLKKIVIHILVTDDSGKTREDFIEVPVYANETPTIELFYPGNVANDIQGRRPSFEWRVRNSDYYVDFEQTLILARGDTLEGGWLGTGRKEVALDRYITDWTPDEDLKPGDYVWGIEVENERGQVVMSNVLHFTIPDLWAELSFNDYTIRRTEVGGDYVSLSWEIYQNGEKILGRNAENELSYFLGDYFSNQIEKGDYQIWLEATTENKFTGQRTTERISNIIEFELEEDVAVDESGEEIQTATPTPTFTLTFTPTITPTMTQTPKPTNTPPPTKTATQKVSYPTLYADRNYNCREGPDTLYEHVADILAGTTYRIIGVASNGWVAIAIDFSYTSAEYCWIGGGEVTGDLSTVQYVEAPEPKYLPIYWTTAEEFLDTNPNRATLIGHLDCRVVADYSWSVSNANGGVYFCNSSLFGYSDAFFFKSHGESICGWDLP